MYYKINNQLSFSRWATLRSILVSPKYFHFYKTNITYQYQWLLVYHMMSQRDADWLRQFRWKMRLALSGAGLEIRKFSNRSTFKLLNGPKGILAGPTQIWPVHNFEVIDHDSLTSDDFFVILYHQSWIPLHFISW